MFFNTKQSFLYKTSPNSAIFRVGGRVLHKKANQQDSDIELITKQDVIDKLHVSSTTLWIWEKRKNLVPVKIGRRIFYKRRDVNNLMGGK